MNNNKNNNSDNMEHDKQEERDEPEGSVLDEEITLIHFGDIQNEATVLFENNINNYKKSLEKYGIIGLLVKIDNIIQKSTEITEDGINVENPLLLRETLLELSNYCKMGVIFLDDNYDF
jgi:hypothetical protein